MPVTPDAQLPIERTLDRQRLTGPGVDALENRKETGASHDTDAEANNILRRRMRREPDMPDTNASLKKRLREAAQEIDAWAAAGGTDHARWAAIMREADAALQASDAAGGVFASDVDPTAGLDPNFNWGGDK